MPVQEFGSYRLVEMLGRGGMGEVWRAVDTAHHDRIVALKILGRWLDDDRYAHLAPERFQGSGDRACDVYALGCVLHEALAGAPPFGRGDAITLMRRHRDEEPPRPSALRTTLPPALDAVIARAPAERPEDRFASASGLAAAVRAALGSGPSESVASAVASGPASGPAAPRPIGTPPAAPASAPVGRRSAHRAGHGPPCRPRPCCWRASARRWRWAGGTGRTRQARPRPRAGPARRPRHRRGPPRPRPRSTPGTAHCSTTSWTTAAWSGPAVHR